MQLASGKETEDRHRRRGFSCRAALLGSDISARGRYLRRTLLLFPRSKIHLSQVRGVVLHASLKLHMAHKLEKPLGSSALAPRDWFVVIVCASLAGVSV
jgi:hypothetical protein